MPSRVDLDLQDLAVMNDHWRIKQIAERNELRPVRLNEREFRALMSFLYTLTDYSSLDMRNTVPDYVPRGETMAE